MINQKWTLAHRPEGLVKKSDFNWVEEEIAIPGPGQFLIRHIYLSLDPTNRVWLHEKPSYLPPVAIGEVMRGLGLGVVEASNHPDFQVGDYISGLLGWQKYLITDGEGLTKIPTQGAPLENFVGALSMHGLTAYFGLMDVGKAKEGETLVVTGAAGAVGSLVGQIGKNIGMRVVGLAGTDEKCKWLTEDLGFDAAINYKTDNVKEKLKEYCPDGIDVYFENVGGPVLQTIYDRMNLHGRIAVCGLISEYNGLNPLTQLTNLGGLVSKRITIQGFLVFDYWSRSGEAFQKMGQWMMQEKLKFRLDVVDGLENAPETLNMLFEGRNRGKLAIKVSEA
ncbi:MAG: NADP-dependent oxidoreductase [Cyclobacteriaceae bacterium]